MAELNETNNIYGLEYEWKLTGLRKVNTNGLDGIIMGTNWTLTGTDENGFSGTFTGATPFKIENLNTASFTPYSELTEEKVISWIKGSVLNQLSYWEHINVQILKALRDTKSPVVIVNENDLPWSPLSGSSPTPIQPDLVPVTEYTSAPTADLNGV
jgi:hypothetical protein